MNDDRTTAAVQRYLDELAGIPSDAPAEPVVRALLARATGRLHLLCSSLLFRSYPRLTRGPLNLESEDLLDAVVGRLIKAMRAVRPGNVRQFFALAGQHMRWELNDLARRLDEQATVVNLRESIVDAPPVADGRSSISVTDGNVDTGTLPVSPNTRRILDAIEKLPGEEREVFTLVRIQGMTHLEAAGVIGLSEDGAAPTQSRPDAPDAGTRGLARGAQGVITLRFLTTRRPKTGEGNGCHCAMRTPESLSSSRRR